MAAPTPPSPEALLQHGDFVRTLARSLVRDPNRADDLAQDAWVAALERPPADDRNVRGWFGRVVRNLAAMRRRGDWRRAERERRAARNESVDPTADIIARLDWERRIVEAVRALDEPYRATIVYRFFEHLDPDEIARRMNVPRKTVYTRLQRALERLRARFDEQTGGDRRAWCLALLPLAVDPRPVTAAATAALATGTATVLTKTTIAATAGLMTASFAVGWAVKPGATDAAPAREVPARRVAEQPGAAEGPPATEPAPAAAPREPAPPAATEDDWVRRVRECSESYYEIVGLANRIGDLPPEKTLAIMRRVLAREPSAVKRRQMLKAFAPSHGHLRPEALEVLDLATRDDDATVREWAIDFLRDFAFRDFHGDPEAYAAWRERWRGRPVGEVIRRSALEFVDRARGLPPGEVARLLRRFDTPLLGGFGSLDALELPRLMKEAGFLDLATAWLAQPERAAAERQRLHDWIHELRPDESYLRRHYLPALESAPASPALETAARALGRRGHRWAVPILLAAVPRTESLDQLAALSEALGTVGDARAVPALIGAMDGATSTDQRTILGRLGLRMLTGVPHDPTQDGAWWRDWWRRNRHFLPAEARHLPIPVVTLK